MSLRTVQRHKPIVYREIDPGLMHVALGAESHPMHSVELATESMQLRLLGAEIIIKSDGDITRLRVNGTLQGNKMTFCMNEQLEDMLASHEVPYDHQLRPNALNAFRANVYLIVNDTGRQFSRDLNECNIKCTYYETAPLTAGAKN